MAKFLKKNPILEFLKNSLQRLKKPNKAAAARTEQETAMDRMRKRIFWQAGLACLTVVLTIVIVFSMSAAWYTNIVHTNGLTFEAEAWGFDGKITVNDDPIEAGPGDDGVIFLEVENESENIAAVSVNVSKTLMPREMQKRLFFYVDTQQVRNEETMSRVYLNNQENYTYTLFGESTLSLTETTHNDAQMKWHWVYDMLGYYVLGTANEDGTDVMEAEYLRPIEYDYDAATTTFKTVQSEQDGEEIITLVMTTVDGETTVEEFLKELSKKDGYKGTIDPDKMLESGHYPVDVDENGYGVYAYLCNYAEIELATQFDTDLGEQAAAGTLTETFPATLTISAQKNRNNTFNVTSMNALETAIELGSADVIQLSGNITVGTDESLVIPKGQRVMLDLNGYEIIGNTSKPAIEAKEGSSLTVLNGALTGTEESGKYAIESVGAQVVLSNVDIAGYDRAVHVSDNAGGDGLDSKVRLIDCEISTSDVTLLIRGNGDESAGLTQVIVENCKIESDGIAICGNGNADQYGTDIQIIGSTVTSNPEKLGAGIYHPQKDSYLTIYNSTITGYTGMCIKGGSVSVVKSTIEGKGENPVEPADNGNGFSDTADAVYIDAGYGHDILLEIKQDSKLTSIKGLSLQVYEENADNVAVRIYSGTFDQEQPDAYIAEGSTKSGNKVTTNE